MKNKIIEAWNTLIYGEKCWKIKVEKFNSNIGSFYSVSYKARERQEWKRMLKALMSPLLAHPDNRNQPFLDTFEKCIEFAEQFKSYDDYKKYEDRELEEFDKLCQRNNVSIAKTTKIWTNY